MMKRRSFIKKAGIATAGAFIAPYILPSGRLFAATGDRVVNHVVFVLFAGGVRHQESVEGAYLADQGLATTGNIMRNMFTGAAPSNNLVYTPWNPVLSSSLASQGTLFKELSYAQGPTGHYNGHAAAITGNYTETGTNLNINPDFPTVFEYYRKHTDPAVSAINSWWMSEGLGPYPALNYSRHGMYGPMYGANYFRPASTFGQLGLDYMNNGLTLQPDDVNRLKNIRNFLDSNFAKSADDLPGIVNNATDRDAIEAFMKDVLTRTANSQVEFPMPNGTAQYEMTGDLINIQYAWEVMKNFHPELLVINTFNLDTCHSDFTGYIQLMHKADYGVGWLWNKIQNDPVLQNDTIMICMPDHGRNQSPNNIYDSNGLRAYDHTTDDNSRRTWALIVGPSSKVNQGLVLGSAGNSVGETIDIVPTIAHILGFYDVIPGGMLPGMVLQQAFI